jgi:hypothetical protein
MKYRTKSVEVEAMQFTTNNENGSPTMDAIVNWINQGRREVGAWHNGTDIFVRSHEGEKRATVGDWIIRGAGGDISSCKSAVFEEMYEAMSS